MGQFVDYYAPTFDIKPLILHFFHFGGTIGNLVFIISSSYFLFGKNTKRERAINLLFDSQFISIIILVIFCILSKLISFRINYSFEFFSSNIFPDLYENVWFVPAYVILYFIHPAIDLVINALSQRKHLGISFSLFVFYSLCGLFKVGPFLSGVIEFIIIYFIVAYIKMYLKDFISNTKKNITIILICTCSLVVGVLLQNFLGLHLTFFENYPRFNNLISFIFLPMMLSLFNLCLNFDFKNKIINYLSSCSLFVYCIHENLLVREEIRPKFYEFMIEKSGGINHCLLNVLLLFLIIVVVSFTAAIIYKHTIHKITAKLSVKAANLICKTLYRITSKLIKENSNEKEAL